MTTCECMHLITSSNFQSQKKYGGHANRSAVGENPMLQAHFTAVCHGRRVIGDGIFTQCGSRHPLRVYLLWTFFCLVTLTLTRGPSYMNLTCIACSYLHIRCIPDVQIQTAYIKSFKSYRLTDIQTYRLNRNYKLRRFAGGQQLLAYINPINADRNDIKFISLS